MKKARIALILGILFGLCLFPVAYVNLVLGIALAFVGNGWFAYSSYVFAVFGVVAIVCSCFAKFRPLVTLVGNGIVTVYLIAVIIYLVGTGLFMQSIGLLLLYLFPAILGATSSGFAAKYLYDAGIKPFKEEPKKE